MKNNKFLKYFFVALLLVSLLAVRFYQDVLFYDPFLDFFRSLDSSSSFSVPDFDETKFWISTIFRYSLNGFLGFLLVYFLFESPIFHKFYLMVIVLGFFLLIPFYGFFVYDGFASNPMIGFYVRRFVIQPLFLVILLPVFFFFNRIEKSNSL